jgi:hypothetical protein
MRLIVAALAGSASGMKVIPVATRAVEVNKVSIREALFFEAVLGEDPRPNIRPCFIVFECIGNSTSPWYKFRQTPSFVFL